MAELTRNPSDFPRSRQKERVRALVEAFQFPRDETAQGGGSAMTVIGALSSFRKPGEMRSLTNAPLYRSLRVTLRFGFVRAVFSADRKTAS